MKENLTRKNLLSKPDSLYRNILIGYEDQILSPKYDQSRQILKTQPDFY